MKTIFAISIILITSSFQQTIASDNNWSIGIGNTGVQFKNSKKNGSSPFFGANYFYNDTDSTVIDTSYAFGLEVGYRSYLEISDINNFMDTSIKYININEDSSSDTNIYILNFMYGVEKYLDDKISIEGSTGVRITFEDHDDFKTTSIFVPATKISLNYRF